MATYLITGVSRGVGNVLARMLLDQGHRILGVARGPVPDLALTGLATLELTDFDGYPAALAGLLAELDGSAGLDGLVHCAGALRAGQLAEQDSAVLTELFATNVTAAAELVRHFLTALRAARGTVVLVNSGSGLAVRPPLSAYGMSKFALRGYADALRQEEPALRVSTIYPGRIDTAMQQEVRAAEAGDYQVADYLRPETVAGLIATVLALPADATVTELTVRPRS
ncbi:MAG TPA: SDR family NAD(P)-dependent oxidoreductase [Jatrophihabitans sp.]|nr:SDR family NAD(P)-dependent oxidoreductase [Jatrophihabitans sp.]